MNRRVWKVAPLLLGSGLCALVYQTAWLRELRLIFGASTAASAAVLAIFMGGLGLGSVLLGARADRHPRPLALYAQLEALVALAAAATPALVWVTRHLYVLLGGTETLGVWGGTAVRLVLSALLLGAPTVLMGGTLPAAARAVADERDPQRRSLGILYGVNTLGAVLGASASTFLLFEALGTRTTLWVACLVNLLVAVVARGVARQLDAPARAAQQAPAAGAVDEAPAARSAVPARFVRVAAAVVGFAFLLMELVWYRMLGPILGGSTFTFGLILISALAGIGLGGAAYAPLFRGRRATLVGFALTCALEAAFIALPFALGDRVAHVALQLRGLSALGFPGILLSWAAITALVVFPAAFVSGVQYPLLIALLGRGVDDVGKQVGQAYAWNTLGSIVGSLAGGFGLIPLLSAPGTWRLAALVLTALAVAALVLAVRAGEPRRALPGPLLTAGLALALALALGPSAAWRHSGIGAGRAFRASTLAEQESVDRLQRQRLLWEVDGVESSVALIAAHGLSFVVNGKSDGNTLLDAGTQVMGGLVGTFLHPAPRRALVVGLGTGSTAGWMGQVPSMERVDVVEIEPAILEVARRAAVVNQRVLENPKVHLLLGDAREVLLASRERYDVIFSEPSNPYRAGIASLFTREFYRAARERLTDDGIFVQWLQAYEVDASTVERVYATLAQELPYISTWTTLDKDLLLVASARPQVLDATVLRERVAAEPYRSALRAVWQTAELEGVLAHHLAAPPFAERAVAATDVEPNTDDHNRIEFGFARSVGRPSRFSAEKLAQLARGLGADRPDVSGAVDWSRVEEQRLLVLPWLGARPGMDEATLRPLAGRLGTFRRLDSDPSGALSHWRTLGWQAHDYGELIPLASAMARVGAPEAPSYLDQLARFSPTEATLLRAELARTQHRTAEAARLLEEGLRAYQSDPWVTRSIGQASLATAEWVARADPTAGRRLFELLEKPLAAYALELERRTTLVELAKAVDPTGLCVRALEASEPDSPWERSALEWRAGCYAATDHPRFELANAELERFRDEESEEFLAPLRQTVRQTAAPAQPTAAPAEPMSAPAVASPAEP